MPPLSEPHKRLGAKLAELAHSASGQTQHMRYVDIMAKQDGSWRFKSMIQAGWGDMLKEYLGA